MSRELSDLYKCVPVAQITEPPQGGFVSIYRDFWWCVTPQDEVLFYKHLYHSPQCNMNRAIAEHLMPEGCTAKQLPIAFVPIKISDYI